MGAPGTRGRPACHRWAPARCLPLALAIVAVCGFASPASSSTTKIIPFPAPPRRHVGLGRLHTLSSLSCDVLPAWGDAASGFEGASITVQQANAAPMQVPRGDRVCAAPITQPSVLSAIRNATVVGRGDCAVGARDINSEFNLEWKPALHGAKAVHNEPLVREDELEAGIFHETEVVRLLTLLRNTVSGGIFRVKSEYDVTGITRRSLGVCADGSCKTMYAVDTASFNIFSANATGPSGVTAVPVVTFARQDGAPPEVVPVDDEAVLSLGRAVLSQPARLAQHPGWVAHLPNRESFWIESRRLADPLPTALNYRGNDEWWWNANDTNADTRPPFLPAIAWTLCAPPARSFLHNPDYWCADLLTPPDVPPPGSLLVDGKRPRPMSPPPGVFRIAEWWISGTQPPDGTPTAGPLQNPDTIHRPCWLTGLGAREINPSSPDEVDLLARVGVATTPVLLSASDLPSNNTLREEHLFSAEVIDDLIHSYDQVAFGKSPPPIPTTNAELILAVVVVLPQAVAQVIKLISTRQWHRRDLFVLFLMFGTGLVSMGGIFSLAAREARGDAWRASGLQRRFSSHHDPDFLGPHLVTISETLLLTARMGYRRHLVVSLAIGVAIVYVTVCVAASGTAWALRRRASKASDGGDDDVEGSPESVSDSGSDVGSAKGVGKRDGSGTEPAAQPAVAASRWGRLPIGISRRRRRWWRPAAAAAAPASPVQPPPPQLSVAPVPPLPRHPDDDTDSEDAAAV